MPGPSKPPLRILLTGASGQVGWELRRTLMPFGPVEAPDSSALNLRDERQIRETVRAFRPDVLVNAAAYTSVDKAETERDACRELNAYAPGILAEEAERLGAWLVHYSTDYVFNGKNGRPWNEDDPPEPLNYYGSTKLEGDRAVSAHSSKHLIFRTSWVYASRGSNFLLTMLRLFSSGKDVRVVNDQRGAPTWARCIAQSTALALKAALEADDPALSGVYNLVSSGVASWYDFACMIREYAGGDRRFGEGRVIPIPSADYPTAAARPSWSVLSTGKIERVFGLYAMPWADALRLCVGEVK